jgi:hypothetical protein
MREWFSRIAPRLFALSVIAMMVTLLNPTAAPWGI